MREVLYSPINGKIKPLDLVNDDVFSKRMLGDGVALIPSDNKILSLVDGVIKMVYDTQHAIGITTSTGVDILIHIGIDTVSLKGAPFKTQVRVGDHVRKGTLLTKVDWDYIYDNGYEKIIIIIIINKQINLQKENGFINIGTPLLTIE